MNVWLPQDQAFWYLKRDAIPPCRENLMVDVAIIGGGMAGLSAAQAFNKRGKKVAVLEQYYCGSGATGKSSGFITPNAELSFTDFSKRYNAETAHMIWDFITSGVDDIRNNIQQYGFACDYTAQDTLMLANTQSAYDDLAIEYHNLAKFGYKTALYDKKTVCDYIGSKQYYGGMSYAETFGINGYAYCQEMKRHLQNAGVIVYEETAVTALNDHALTTPHATITADYIVVCTDRFMPELGLLTQDVYHVQTFLMISEPLTDAQIRAIFPEKNRLVWDSELIYTYFRLTGDKRLLLGGGSIATTYAAKADHENVRMYNQLTRYFNARFPDLNVQFKQFWPGLIGISKDIAPLCGRDKDKPYQFYIAGAAGLSIAAALGRYSAENLLEGNTALDPYFSPYRSFPIGGMVQSIIGTKLSFALSNIMKK